MKKALIVISILAVIGIVVYMLMKKGKQAKAANGTNTGTNPAGKEGLILQENPETGESEWVVPVKVDVKGGKAVKPMEPVKVNVKGGKEIVIKKEPTSAELSAMIANKLKK